MPPDPPRGSCPSGTRHSPTGYFTNWADYSKIHITVMFRLATMDADGKESTTENPCVLKEHAFVISDDPLQDFDSVHHAQRLIGKHLTQDLKVTVNR